MEQAVIVSKKSFNSKETYDIIGSNISFVNALGKTYLREDEISADALKSYYVDYYLAQVNNGGFSQFVYNTRWSPVTIRYVKDGLKAMKAERHLELFNKSAAILDQMGPEKLQKFFESEYFGTNAERDVLNAHSDAFDELSESEDLIKLNAAWLRGLPNLIVMTVPEMEAEVSRRAAALPDLEERKREALANEPRYMKLMRALALKAGHEFSHATAGDPSHKHNGKEVLAWHFLTDKGHFYMVEDGGKAIMFHGDTNARITVIDAP